MSIEIPPETTFEAAQDELAARVAKLESGEVGLDDAVRIFEEAIAYQRFCETRLAEIKGRIEELAASDLPADAGQAGDTSEGDTPF